MQCDAEDEHEKPWCGIGCVAEYSMVALMGRIGRFGACVE